MANLVLRVVLAEPSVPLVPRGSPSARTALLNVGGSGVWVVDECGPRSRTYRVGEAFLQPIHHRAHYVARALTAYCLCSEGPFDSWCGARAREGSRYCSRHERSEKVVKKDWRERELRAVLDVVKPALLSAPPPFARHQAALTRAEIRDRMHHAREQELRALLDVREAGPPLVDFSGHLPERGTG